MFVRSMTDGMIGRHLVKTGDGVRWDNPAIDHDEMNKMMKELWFMITYSIYQLSTNDSNPYYYLPHADFTCFHDALEYIREAKQRNPSLKLDILTAIDSPSH